jgi:hypothetical protein
MTYQLSVVTGRDTEPVSEVPSSLIEWAECYPMLSLRTVALCVWQVSQTSRFRHLPGDRNAAIAGLIRERLDGLRADLNSR